MNLIVLKFIDQPFKRIDHLSSDLDFRRVEAHVVDPAASWMDPSVAQPLP